MPHKQRRIDKARKLTALGKQLRENIQRVEPDDDYEPKFETLQIYDGVTAECSPRLAKKLRKEYSRPPAGAEQSVSDFAQRLQKALEQ